MQRMVSDMLFLARIDHGIQTIAKLPVDLRQEVDSVVEFYELAASEKGQSIAVHGSASTAIQGDLPMIRRAITNLLTNAVRYAPPGSAISIEIAEQGAADQITVCNAGGPIPKEELEQLFRRFARGENATSRDTDGVGLGLAIVDSIVKLHGGSVSVENRGELVCFSLLFPHTD
ncbi:hypothetical protein GCM10027296_21170 [Chitinimonas naiadis]